ncbi:YjhX family toxin [Magnetospirillum sulfuroxidans]|nr:YjhX family toxin [Magnetospirillum sulfuroxidans]
MSVGHVRDCRLLISETVKRLKRRRLIASSARGPDRMTRLGLTVVRPQLDNC